MSYNPKELKSGFNNIDTEVNYTFVGRDPITNKEHLKSVSLKPGIDFNSIEEKYEKVIEIDKQSLIEQLEPAFNDVFVSEELEKYNNDSKFRKKVEEYLNGLKTGKFNNRDFIGMLNDEREKATNIIENKSLDKLLDFLMALTSNRVRDSKMPTLKKERGKTVFEDATEITLYDKKELISKKYLRYVLKEGNISYLDTLKMDSNLFDKQYAIEMVLRSLTYIHPYVDHILENDAEYGTMKNQLLFRIRKLIGKNSIDGQNVRDNMKKMVMNCMSEINEDEIDIKSGKLESEEEINGRKAIIKNYKIMLNFAMQNKLISPEELDNLNYFSIANFKDVYKTIRDNKVNGKGIIELMGTKAYQNEVIKAHKDMLESQENYEAKRYFDRLIKLPNSEIVLIDLLRKGEISKEEFNSSGLTWEKLLSKELSGEDLKTLINNNLIDKNKIEFDRIAQFYGDSISGKDIINFINNGYFKDSDLIKLSKYQSVQITNKDKAISLEDLRKFYTPDRLEKMYQEGQLKEAITKNGNVAKWIGDNLVSKLSDDDKIKLYENIINTANDIKTDNRNVGKQEVLLDYVNLGLIPKDEKFIKNIPGIDDAYSLCDIPEDKLLEYSKNRILNPKIVAELYPLDENVRRVNNGELDEDVLKYVDKTKMKEIIKNGYFSGDISPKLLVHLYTKGVVFGNKEFKKLIKERPCDVKEYISEEHDINRLKDLIILNIVNINEFNDLLTEGKISQEEFDELRTEIKPSMVGEKLRELNKSNSDLIMINTDETEESHSRRASSTKAERVNKNENNEKDYFTLIQEFMQEYLNIGDENTFVPIRSYKLVEDKNGNTVLRKTSLDGYKLMIEKGYRFGFLAKPKRDNSIYMLDCAQLYATLSDCLENDCKFIEDSSKYLENDDKNEDTIKITSKQDMINAKNNPNIKRYVNSKNMMVKIVNDVCDRYKDHDSKLRDGNKIKQEIRDFIDIITMAYYEKTNGKDMDDKQR